MTTWKWNGARWWKFDFHAHTPASEDYGKGPDQQTLRQRTAREWLLDFMRAGIDCVAVTDHNSGAWVDKLTSDLATLASERPAGFRPLWLFPGVELTVHGGVHLLAIFDLQKRTSDIDSVLGAVGFRGTKGSSDACTELSFVEVVEQIEKAGGIAIPAHVDQVNGLFRQLQGPSLKQAVNCPGLFAMELCGVGFAKPQSYQELERPWAEVVGSDAHRPSGATPCTWIKMSDPTLEGLRLALLDGPLSVRRFDSVPPDPNAHGANLIEAIEVEAARYMGRTQTFVLPLNPWLNGLIGGRGTGKSTLVEFVRTCLRRVDELPEALQEDLEKYQMTYAARTDDGLLTPEARLAVIYRKDGTRFRVQWDPQGNLAPIERQDDTGAWSVEHGDVAQRFPVRIYSQKQIFELAKTPLALLRIVDEAAAVDRRAWNDRWRELVTRFLSLRAKARELNAGLAEESRFRGELDDAKHKLKVYEEAGHTDVLRNYQKRLRQTRALETWEAAWSDAGDRLRGISLEFVPDPLDNSAFEPDTPEDRELLARAGAALEHLVSVRQKLEALAGELDEAVREWRIERDGLAWKRTADLARQEYAQLVRKLAEQKAGDPSEYGELLQRTHVLEDRLLQLGAQKETLANVRREADVVLAEILAHRRQLSRRRNEFLSEALKSNPYVRITLAPYGCWEEVEADFRRLIQRESGFDKDIGTVDGETLLGLIYGRDTSAAGIENSLTRFKQEVKSLASGGGTLHAVRDQRFTAHLSRLPPEAWDRLDLWFPEDAVIVEYSTTSDGRKFRSIQEGSPGQRTAALLAFLLSYGDEPIVLDQPEDDLDNHLIYELIVTQLRNIKQRRQVLVVTHNANIVVNGDAELVVALSAKRGETQADCVGSLQEQQVRKSICEVMEGGPEAFKQRYRRITLEARYV